LEQSADQVADLAAQVAAEICRKLLPHTSQSYAAQEVAALVKALMPSLAGQSRLLVRVHPDLVGPVRAPLEKVAERSGFEGKLLVVEGENMALSDARVEWPDGGAERNTDRLWEEVDDLIARNIPHFSRDEALELPGDPKKVDENPWGDADESAYWTPPTVRQDLDQAYQAPPAEAAAAQSAPPDSAPLGKAPQPSAPAAETVEETVDEDIDPFALLGGDPAEDEEDDFDDFGLTAEQEAELAALDAQLKDVQQAAEDEEK
jgi:hypothetical protein